MSDQILDWLKELLMDAGKKLPLPKVSDEADGCPHDAVPPPAFDLAAASGLEAEEVRRRWPRFHGVCPTCQGLLISYASYEHYILGDW